MQVLLRWRLLSCHATLLDSASLGWYSRGGAVSVLKNGAALRINVREKTKREKGGVRTHDALPRYSYCCYTAFICSCMQAPPRYRYSYRTARETVYKRTSVRVHLLYVCMHRPIAPNAGGLTQRRRAQHTARAFL